jgi:metal-sulfur cluster biosynthetic enzyme
MEHAPADLSRFLPAVDEDAILERLRTVMDPELGLNIVDLGLVYESDVRAGVAHVVMTTTSPACPIGSFLEDQVRWALLEVPGVVDVDVEVTHEPAWSPQLMTPAARVAMGWKA